MSKVGFHFTGGPSKESLQLALFNGNQLKNSGVVFGKSLFRVEISSIEREDGSYESWNIEGRADNVPVKIYYRTDNRTGTVAYV